MASAFDSLRCSHHELESLQYQVVSFDNEWPCPVNERPENVVFLRMRLRLHRNLTLHDVTHENEGGVYDTPKDEWHMRVMPDRKSFWILFLGPLTRWLFGVFSGSAAACNRIIRMIPIHCGLQLINLPLRPRRHGRWSKPRFSADAALV